MFGYIRAFQPELKLRELDEYKAVYCGLCRQLGRRFGLLARFSLNYDYTFLAMLYACVSGEKAQRPCRRCAVHPLRRCPTLEPCAALEYSCNVAALMTYHKLRDDLADEKTGKRLCARLLLLFAAPACRKAHRALPELAELFSAQFSRQPGIEADSASCLDLACEPSAVCLSAVLGGIAQENAATRRILERMGYLLGRYVYMADALDDLDDDIKAGGYNPFRDTTREEAVGSLRMTIGEIGTAYDLLERGEYSPVLDNILYIGLRATVEEIRVPKDQRRVNNA